MKWYRNLYLGDGIKKSQKELIKRIETNAGVPGIYLITLAANGRDLLDIFSADLLMQPVLHGHCPLIVGAAKGREEAIAMATALVLAAYQEKGDFDLFGYLKSCVADEEEAVYEYPMEQLKKRKRFGFRK